MVHFTKLSTAVIISLVSSQVIAMSDESLEQTTLQRLEGDRTGACFAVAVIETIQTYQAFVCADTNRNSRVTAQSDFEVGSVTKTMTGTLLATLITDGKASLDDPLSEYLPDNADVPAFEGKPILLKHIVTHTSGLPGLPPGVTIANPLDPYASMGQQAMLDGLENASLSQEPGSRYEYSNFAAMLLSWAISRRAGQDFATLAKEQLFNPLKMQGAFVQVPNTPESQTKGHVQTGVETPPWTFNPELAGVGGVRATLNDMVKYIQAHLGVSTSDLNATLVDSMALTHQSIDWSTDSDNSNNSALFWTRMSVGSDTLLTHGGGTGGFSSFVAMDIDRQRAAIVLSDTALTSLGGLGSFARHLLYPDMTLEQPRKTTDAPAELIKELAGQYQLQGGMGIELSAEDNALSIQAEGQPSFILEYDTHGDFYPLAFDALLVPVKRTDGSMSFVWHQGGAQMPARRLDASANASALTLDQAQLQAYLGQYPLQPDFILTVSEKGGALYAQATGQGEFPIEPIDKDMFESFQYGIEIHFERDNANNVVALSLLQGGHTMHAMKQPDSQ